MKEEVNKAITDILELYNIGDKLVCSESSAERSRLLKELLKKIKPLIQQLQERQVDEKWIKKKADIIWTCHWESLKEVKDFIRSIALEIQKLQKEE